MHMHYLELCLNETARVSCLRSIQGSHSIPGGTSDCADTSTSSGNTLGFDHLDFSWRSVGAIKAWIGVFLSLPPTECAGLSFMHMAQLARCLMVLYRLSTFVHPGWDCDLVRNTVDLLRVLDGVADKLEMASREAGEQLPEDLFMHLSGMMRKFHANAAPKIGRRATAAEVPGWLNGAEEAGTGEGEAGAIHSQTLLPPMSQSDEEMLESIFGGFGGEWTV